MAGSFTITVDLRDIAKLDPWAKGLKQKVLQTMTQVFEDSIPGIQARERVKTGFMRESTTASATGSGAQVTAAAGYSGYQNFGTRFMSGTHFMDSGFSFIIGTLPGAINVAIAL